MALMNPFGGSGKSAPSGSARNRPHGNLLALRIAVVVLFGILTAQLFRMQVIRGDEYRERSRQNHITQEVTLATRGLILDRQGEPLVQNVPNYIAQVVPELLPGKPEERYAIYLRLEQLTGTPALEIQTRVDRAFANDQAFIAINVATHLSKERAIRLDEATMNMPGVSLVTLPARTYVAGLEFAHVLGYIGAQNAEEYAVNRDLGYALNEPVGKAGVEARYERELRGQRGITQAEQNAEGRLIKALASRDAVPGHNVRLAIDAGLQRFIYQELEANLRGNEDNRDATVAAVVVMDAQTGELVALVSLPGYDNNIWSDPNRNTTEFDILKEDPRKPFLNQAITPSAPGSTFKLVTAAAGLQNGSIKPETSRAIDSRILEVKGENGVIYNFYDWTTHGTINLYGAIARSSNIYFYMTSCGIPNEYRGLGKDDESSAVILGYYARLLGFGAPTGLDIGGEEPGIIPDPAWKRRVHADDNEEDRQWYYADTCFMGIGQGDVSATPLQVARMTGAIATGKLVTPHVAKEIVDSTGKVVRTIPTEAKELAIDKRWLQVIREGMLQSVTGGAGAQAYRDGIDIAGKTGTAEFFLPDGTKAQHAWFTGFAPYDDPRYVVTVYFDIGVGGEKAAPLAGRIFTYLWNEVDK
jgi:penicillin-binding protein 2